MFDTLLCSVRFDFVLRIPPMAWQRARDAGPDGYANPAAYQRWLGAASRRIRAGWVAGGDPPPPIDVPCEAEITYYLHRPARRPAGYPRDLWDLPPTPAIGRSDVDNYAAATMDAITRAGVWTDDTRCARLTASKVWIREQDSDEYTHIMISTYTSVW